MKNITLLIMAAGMGSRYGGLKQLDPVGPNGETIIDYSVYDAIRAGFNKVVFIIRREFEKEFKSQITNKYEGSIQVEFAFQELNNLPDGFDCPPDRQKPWGTGHAILSAFDLIQEPFVVINGDDFYGLESYQIVSDYYKNNKNSFTRKQDEILLKHFVLPTKKEANKLKGLLKSNRKGDQLEKYVEKYKPKTKTIKKGFINESLIGFVFDGSVGDILGPKKIKSSYHVFDILRKNNKGSFKGLEIVYDEIHQRLFKTREMQLLNNFLDSLYTNADIYISPEVGK